MSLEQEIARLDQELQDKHRKHDELRKNIDTLRYEATLLSAELAGLRERRKTLAQAMGTDTSTKSSVQKFQTVDEETRLSILGEPKTGSAREEPARQVDLSKVTLVDAVTHVIKSSHEPMRIEDVRLRLQELGREEDYTSVSVTLHYAQRNNRIKRVSRGLYGPA